MKVLFRIARNCWGLENEKQDYIALDFSLRNFLNKNTAYKKYITVSNTRISGYRVLELNYHGEYYSTKGFQFLYLCKDELIRVFGEQPKHIYFKIHKRKPKWMSRLEKS